MLPVSVFVPRAREGISATTLNPSPIPPVCPSYIVSSELPKVYIGLKPELNIDALQDNIEYFYLALIVQKPVLKLKGNFQPKLTVATFFL